MRRSRLSIPWLLILSLAPPAALAAARPPTRHQIAAEERFAAAREALVGRVAGGELPSVAVAVVERGRVLWEEAIGWADREAGEPATVRSVYGLGSLGKSVAATAVLVLAERGEIALDEPVTDFLPPGGRGVFDGLARPPTIREVLQMAGGIPHGHVIYYGGEHTAPSREEMVERYVAAAVPPGRHYEYSNFAYLLLEAVVEKASGRTYPEFVRSEVFVPLGMSSSSVGEPAGGWGRDWAVRYGRSGSPIPTMIAAPQSSLDTHSTLHDLLLYGLFHLGLPQPGQRPILNPAALERMHSDRSGLPGALMALGWAVLELERGTLVLSNGLVSGASAALLLLPERQALVLALANVSSDGVTDEIAFDLADALIPGLEEDLRQLTEARESARLSDWSPPEGLLGAWQGEVSTPDGDLPLALLFQPDGDIHVRLGDQPRGLLDRLEWTGERLSGVVLGALPWSETGDQALELSLTVFPEGDRLLGWATASLYDGERFFSLPARLRLARQ